MFRFSVSVLIITRHVNSRWLENEVKLRPPFWDSCFSVLP